jgi:hypothetical protein
VFQITEKAFSEFNEFYDEIKKIDSNTELEERAKNRAKSYQDPIYLKHVFRVGGYFFKA